MIDVVLDPEIFRKAAKGNDYEILLTNISASKKSMVFTMDLLGRLLGDYKDFLDDCLQNRRHNRVASNLAQYIYRFAPRKGAALCSLTSSVDVILSECKPPLNDPYLVKLVIGLLTIEATCIVLVLDKSASCHGSCLCKGAVRSALEKELSSKSATLKIVCNPHSVRNLESLCHKSQNTTNERQHVSMFEMKVERWMCRHFDCTPTASEDHKFKDNKLFALFTEEERDNILGNRCEVEIDAYCYQKSGDDRLVCIGECYLPDSSDYVGIDKVNQLKIQMQVVERRERERISLEGRPLAPCKIRSFIVSNVAMDAEAKREAKNYGIEYVRVEMPKRWRSQPNWELTDDRFKIIPL